MHGSIKIMEFEYVKADIKEDMPYDLILSDCLSAKKIAQTKCDIDSIGYSSKASAECYRRLGLIDNAIEEYTLALSCFKETQNIKGKAWTKWAYANLLRQQTSYYDSITELMKAYFLANSIGDIHCCAYSVAGIAEGTRIIGNYSLSFSQHLYALALFKKLKDYRGIVWRYEGIAQMYKNCGSIKRSFDFFKTALMEQFYQ
jgi:tetratricopeptide (TPR) repeat protein